MCEEDKKESERVAQLAGGIYSSNLNTPWGGGIFVPSGKKWGGIFVLGDFCANIYKIRFPIS
jgi:hypothetical protein